MGYWSILLSIVIGALIIYYYFFKKFNFFKRHNVLHLPSLPVLGVMAPVLFRQMSFGGFLNFLYNYRPDAKYYGFYAMTLPVFLFRDPELIKAIFIKDFKSFHDRRTFADVNDPLINKNMFSLQGKKWREVRTLLSPAFTAGKMKFMFSLMSECAVNFATFMSSLSKDQNELELKEAFTKYTNDVIATCAFGIKMDTMRDPTNKFYMHGRNSTRFLEFRTIMLIFLKTFSIGRILNLRLVDEEVTNYFTNIIKTIIKKRDTENITRPDMLQLMMDVRGKAGKELDIEEMVAQAFVFFFAGFETTSTAITFLTYEIAMNPDVQARLQQDIDKVLEETNGQVTYEAINQLQYLDAVILEATRMYPSNSFIERVCVKDYELPPTLPGEKPFTMKKGMVVWVPVYSLQHDEKYYDEPDKFRPERFMNNTNYENSPYYTTFGIGPRMCIGKRFAMLEIKLLLFHLLARCELKPCSRTTIPMRLDNKGLQMGVEGGLWLSIWPRSDVHPALASPIINDDTVNS
ncbi:cytochrome P450 9e2-like [Odontomachus brunneus]|uniref:cytochrome P450 9e2-like n=1 Tax=Odontomachus brunneus TaxID=486640 RepID=UPI0013F1801F|nr:cytochrome P450 9e2-like [Odontomachus brunneus]